jgi:sugar O-acyltransferase (sialic acid O-acetyltransferase NeuD family)
VPVTVLYPLLNPNETEAMLAAVHVSEGQRVAADDLLFTLETTKSTADVTAEADGFIAGLHAVTGETVSAGDIFCYLSETEEWTPPPEPVSVPEKPSATVRPPTSSAPISMPVPDGLRITQPALALAQQAGIDLSRLPIGPLVTENMVKEAAGHRVVIEREAVITDPISGNPHILIYGGGGHGKALIDLLRTLGTYHLAGVVDDGFPVGESVMGLPVLGGGDALADLYARGIRLAINAVGGIGNVQVRIKVFQTLAEAGFTCPTVVHPTAWVEASASLADGVQIFPHAYVGSEAQVGFGSIINTGAIVSHECVLGDCVNISPGAMLAGRVQVGDGALIGMGVTVNLQVRVGAGARVGNSATVKADVPPKGIVRAGTVHP